ncbi:probable linoleate 9S-lipoxygenase 5 isoform X2 [Zingiber officinale]|uniref:probable linoleate 9S-lipoxygenase 5 isoform X2 n=1 Tax=Zingiber officinale TaxID=94328 RepID=UPI001C4AA049|nr:probable linoleate 9S-lipoxygenase 5 isoform X2 [Zingiber officinale]
MIHDNIFFHILWTDGLSHSLHCLPLLQLTARGSAREEMLHKLCPAIAGRSRRHQKESAPPPVKVNATVVLVKKNVLGFNDFSASLLDNVGEFLGNRVRFHLVSSTAGEPIKWKRQIKLMTAEADKSNRGRIGPPAYLEHWGTLLLKSVTAGESKFNLQFEWDESLGIPGAVIVKNHHHSEFFLKSVTLPEGVPGHGKRIHFVCNSWVYPVKKYKYDRIFFSNDAYLPSQTPELLKAYRAEELVHLRGDDVSGALKEHDRVYAYAYYNDLGQPDKGRDHVRPVLGGSKDLPYPRRGRTGRRPTKSDRRTESRLPLLSLDIYVPRDERFGHLKMADFLGYTLKALTQSLLPALNAVFDFTPMEFDTFQDVLNLYDGGLRLPQLDDTRDQVPVEMLRELVRTDGDSVLKLPLPSVIQHDREAWRSDEEFGREMLAGVNPVIIRRLQEFPPTSKLDPKLYGDHTSSITAAHIERNLEGRTVDEALKANKLFILDHHGALIPFLNRINSGANRIYATRTLLLLKDDGKLKPLAIELSLPHPDGEQHGAVNRVFTPAEVGVQGSIWSLAKAYAAVNDSGYHQLISHWLNTHAVMEPFVIATNRQLSVVHPVHKLLSPHYRDTMNINAFARQTLINAGGILEATVFPGKYALELSAVVYKGWKLTEQALPDDLLKRGVAVEDPASPHKVRLLIEDYPYAVDGLEIWSAIQTWVTEYCAIYYPDDALVGGDVELQAWWKEVREDGHGDKKDEPWWPKLETVAELTKTCTTIIWVASALHAAVNFGQFPYAGYLPNRPTISRRWMPEPGTPDYEELEKNPDLFFLKTITSQLQTILGVSLIEVLSRHSSDEVYLGQRDTPEWTSDEMALEAFDRFGQTLIEIENRIMSMNRDPKFKNRTGPVKMPYMLLYPNTSDLDRVGGLTGRGIPNSVSI